MFGHGWSLIVRSHTLFRKPLDFISEILIQTDFTINARQTMADHEYQFATDWVTGKMLNYTYSFIFWTRHQFFSIKAFADFIPQNKFHKIVSWANIIYIDNICGKKPCVLRTAVIQYLRIVYSMRVQFILGMRTTRVARAR